jgi:hypothetical protein
MNPHHIFGLLLNNEQAKLRAELLLLEPYVNRQFKHELNRLVMATTRFKSQCLKLAEIDYDEIEELGAQLGEEQDKAIEELFEGMDI